MLCGVVRSVYRKRPPLPICGPQTPPLQPRRTSSCGAMGDNNERLRLKKDRRLSLEGCLVRLIGNCSPSIQFGGSLQREGLAMTHGSSFSFFSKKGGDG